MRNKYRGYGTEQIAGERGNIYQNSLKLAFKFMSNRDLFQGLQNGSAGNRRQDEKVSFQLFDVPTYYRKKSIFQVEHIELTDGVVEQYIQLEKEIHR